MKSFYLTDCGKVRSHNEDSVIITRNINGDYMLAVADGMGGHRAGEVASSITITYLSKKFKDTFKDMSKKDAIEWLKSTVTEINNILFKYTKDHPESTGMGTTLVVSIVTDSYILIGNIGDSSGFVVKNNKIHKVTYDHTLVNLLVTAGEITEEEAINHPKKNVLMKALGANDPIDIDIYDCDMEIDSILLTSDGLTNMLSFEQIENVITSDMEVEEIVNRLIVKANNRGGADNISVAFLRIKEVDSK